MGLNMKNQQVAETCNKLYSDLTASGYDVLFDDRIDAQAGFKFKDADLLGMPLQLIIGDKKLKDSKVEIKIRETGERFDVGVSDVNAEIKKLLKGIQ
jgi:prolyl-tRNA synthetase